MSIYTLKQIYTDNDINFQKERYSKLCESFEKQFGEKPQRFFSASGRTEVCGNHTDHNHGLVLAAGVSLDCIAAVVPTDDGIISFCSLGFGEERIDTSDLEAKQDELGTTAALIRGVCAGFAQRGLKVGGFKACSTSSVYTGSGLSSSAAFEVLVGDILGGLYNEGSVSDIEIAKISQYAENEFYGKPSGLMDQMACSVGGFTMMDFRSEKDPIVTPLKFDLSASGYSLCIVNTMGDHADLTPDYAAIPAEMKAVAQFFGKSVLREISREELEAESVMVRRKCGDRAFLRALHFFDENERVKAQAQALKNGDLETFFGLVNESGESSMCWLQNIFSCSKPQNQGLSVALYAAKKVLGNKGACRVHGGGFAGTIQAFVPDDLLDSFKLEMIKLFGDDCYDILSIRNVGGGEIDLGGAV